MRPFNIQIHASHFIGRCSPGDQQEPTDRTWFMQIQEITDRFTFIHLQPLVTFVPVAWSDPFHS